MGPGMTALFLEVCGGALVRRLEVLHCCLEVRPHVAPGLLAGSFELFKLLLDARSLPIQVGDLPVKLLSGLTALLAGFGV